MKLYQENNFYDERQCFDEKLISKRTINCLEITRFDRNLIRHIVDLVSGSD